MAVYTGTCNFYTKSKLKALSAALDLSTGNFYVALTTSSHTPLIDTHEYADDITNELSGSGYARVLLTSLALAISGSNVYWDFDDAVFTASGGSLVGYNFHVLKNNGVGDASNELILFGLLDETPASVTTTDGNTETIQWNALGLVKF
jgi:hypothetical protein